MLQIIQESNIRLVVINMSSLCISFQRTRLCLALQILIYPKTMFFPYPFLNIHCLSGTMHP